MYTLFDFLIHVGCLIGAWFAGKYGYAHFGWWGALGGIVLGGLAGLLIGRLPWLAAATWMRFDLRQSSVETLKSRLERQYFISHLLIAELVRRGEAPEQFRAYVDALLQSEQSDKRNFGAASARVWFPDLLPGNT
jgi:hypothetical protein